MVPGLFRLGLWAVTYLPTYPVRCHFRPEPVGIVGLTSSSRLQQETNRRCHIMCHINSCSCCVESLKRWKQSSAAHLHFPHVCLFVALILTPSSSLILTSTRALRTNKWTGLISATGAKHHRLTFTEQGSSEGTGPPEAEGLSVYPQGGAVLRGTIIDKQISNRWY